MRRTSIAVTSPKRATKFSPGRQRLMFALLTFSSLTSGGAALAGGPVLPTGGHFVGGSGAITQGGNHLTVNQSTQLGIINWQSFSIGKGDSVTIANGKGATLNRVTGADMSTIAGSLKSTGSIYLVNQAGVVVGPGGKVATNGSFVASTRDASNSDFMAGGDIQLSGDSSGNVVNQGSITSTNGDVVLVGKSVSNSGAISAAKGNAALAAGNNVLLQASGDDAVLVEAGSGDVTNAGTVQAAQVALNAVGGNVYALAVNNGGVIRATGTATKDGHVYLTGGDQVTVNGTVAATNADGSGGAVEVTAPTVKIGGKARISANGAGAGAGGTVLIGGDRHGGKVPATALSKTPIANAQTTTVAAGAWIGANGGDRGDGGNVVIWSDQTTNFTGHISAQAGAHGGNGGQVEVSSEGKLGFAGGVSTLARRGKTGTLLLDPQDVTIYSSTDTNLATFTNSSASSFIQNSTISAMLESNNVVISTSGGSGGNGDIHIGTNGGTGGSNAAPIYWDSAFSLTLSAAQLIDMPGGNPSASTGGANPNASQAGILINSLGAGALTLSAGGAGLTAAATVISITGDIAAHGGTISFISTGPTYRIEGGNQQNITNTADNGAGTIIFQADQVRLGTNSGPTTIVSTPGEVDIVPTSPGAVVIGDTDPTGAFFNDDNKTLIRTEDIFNITANLLVIGSTNTTTLSIETANPAGEALNSGFPVLDASEVNTLKLVTGPTGSVTQDANTAIIVSDGNRNTATGVTGRGALVVQTGTIDLTNPLNSVGSISFQATGGDIAFAAAPSLNGTLVIGANAGISGISTSGGAHTVSLAINGDTVTQSSGAANAITPTSGTINLELTTTAGGTVSSFTLDNPANAVTTLGAKVSTLALYDNVSLSTGTAGATTGVTATGDVAIVDNGALTIGSGAGLATTGGNIQVEDQTFTNSDAGGAFSASGTWRVYSQNPTRDSDDGSALSYSFVQYNAPNSYTTPFANADAALNSSASGNGFIYTVAPTLKETVSGTFDKTYDGTNAFLGSLSNSGITNNYSLTQGGINNDQISFSNPAGTGSGAATYAQSNAGTNIAINLTNPVTFTAKDQNNVQIFGYRLSVTDNLKGDIDPKGVTVSGTRAYNGTTNAQSGILSVVSGELAGDGALRVTGAGALASKNASATATNISNLTGLGLSGSKAGDYTITRGTVLVTPLDVTVTGTRAYDGNTTASGGILSVNGEISGDGTLTVTGSGTLASKNASATPIDISSLGTLDLSGANAGNYHIASGTVTVTPKIVTVTGTRTYNGTTGAAGAILTVSGEISGDPTLTVTGSGTLASKNARTTPTNISGLGTLALLGAGSGNYSIGSGTVTVTPAVLTFTPVAFQKVYDGVTLNNSAYSDMLSNYAITGYVNGENATSAGISLSGSMAFDGSTTTVVKNAGTYTQRAGTLALTSDNGNYVLNFTNPHPNNYVITPLAVTLADLQGTRVYDGENDAEGSILTITDLKAGDQVTVTGVGVLAGKNVGKEQITDLGTLHLTGADAINYTLSASNPDDFVIVTKATLTVSAVTQTKIYDGATASTMTPTVTGLQTGDSLTGTLDQSYGSRNVLGADKSTLSAEQDIGVNDGNGGGNYVIVYKTALGTITPEHVTVTASPNTKTYDGTTTATATPTVTSGTIYDPDTGHFTESYNTSNAGAGLTLTPTGSISDRNGGNNYIITFVPISGSQPGPGGKSGIINPEPLTISALTDTKVYDGTTISTLTPIITSGMLIGADTLTNLSQAFNAKNVLGLNGSTLSVNSDYVLTNAEDYAVTLKTAPGTITPLAIDLTGTRVYDGTTDVDGSILTITNLVGGDTVGVTGAGTSSSPHVGAHDITGGDLALTGVDAANYTLTGGAETVKITPLAVVLTGTRVYDGATDGDSSILSITNAVAGDTVTVTSGASTIASRNVGDETIINFGTLSLGGTSAGDYTLVGARGDVTVTPEAITVTAVTGAKPYDGTDTSTGTPIVTSGTIYGPDTGKFIQTYGNSGPGNSITLTPSGSVDDGNEGRNYTITYVPVSGTITPATTPNDNLSNQIDDQTSSGNGTQVNFTVPDSGIVTLAPRQNGVVTGTIATIDGADYHPDSQLGCTLGQAGCIQNGVAPTTTSTPQ
jgi:filamentous hemagglutinin family protein